MQILLRIWRSIGWEVLGEKLSWWTPTRTTINWPLVILNLLFLFIVMNVRWLLCHTVSSSYRSKHMTRNVSKLHLCAHTLKVEAATWLWRCSCTCDQCPGEDDGEHVQNEVQALSFCQDHRVCELRKCFFFCLHLLRTSQQLAPICCNKSTTSLVHNFLSQQSTRLFPFLSNLMDFFVAGRDQSAANQPNNLAEVHLPL
jgi:hypothetical protein